MDGVLRENTLERIDAALARIEAVLRQDEDVFSASFPELEARHERLREAVSAALSQLDALIGAHRGEAAGKNGTVDFADPASTGTDNRSIMG